MGAVKRACVQVAVGYKSFICCHFTCSVAMFYTVDISGRLPCVMAVYQVTSIIDGCCVHIPVLISSQLGLGLDTGGKIWQNVLGSII